MPIYEYKCPNGHLFEAVQSMSDDPIAECEVCGATVERVFHPVAVHFKGSGFYSTDYGSKKRGGQEGKDADAAGKENDSAKSSSSKPDSKKDSKPDSKKDAKPKATSASTDD